jgi:hypothetical protein
MPRRAANARCTQGVLVQAADKGSEPSYTEPTIVGAVSEEMMSTATHAQALVSNLKELTNAMMARRRFRVEYLDAIHNTAELFNTFKSVKPNQKTIRANLKPLIKLNSDITRITFEIAKRKLLLDFHTELLTRVKSFNSAIVSAGDAWQDSYTESPSVYQSVIDASSNASSDAGKKVIGDVATVIDKTIRDGDITDTDDLALANQLVEDAMQKDMAGK